MRHIDPIVKFFRRYNELWLGPLGLVLYLISSRLIKTADPEAVPYTTDAIQKILFGHLVFASCALSAWVCLRLTWPSVFNFLIDHFNKEFHQLTICDKLKLSFLVFACYLLGLILSMQVL